MAGLERSLFGLRFRVAAILPNLETGEVRVEAASSKIKQSRVERQSDHAALRCGGFSRGLPSRAGR
jgi:hypothetical protein